MKYWPERRDRPSCLLVQIANGSTEQDRDVVQENDPHVESVSDYQCRYSAYLNQPDLMSVGIFWVSQKHRV